MDIGDIRVSKLIWFEDLILKWCNKNAICGENYYWVRQVGRVEKGQQKTTLPNRTKRCTENCILD